MAMKPRTDLQTLMESMLGSREVYFQPPESIKIKYPCIIYELASMNSRKANNGKYKTEKCYTVTIISKDPDYVLPDKFQELAYCNFDRSFKSDNLNHWVFRLYW